ncbi:MAG TPA: penicillin-binding transpeptidase domain-containing protein [Candidatus Limnocylindria bacterium]|nr:penicillin-binding transpeptidase domain-containing protein [Candidatus Limnocylindria bacterium]
MSGDRELRARLGVMAGVFAVAFLLLGVRAADLTVVRGPDFVRQAARQHRQKVTLTGQRGQILDRRGELLASSLSVPSLYVRPAQVPKDPAIVRQLARAADLSEAEVRERLARPSPFVWLRRHAKPSQRERLEALGLPGTGSVPEPRRFYPHGSLAAHVLGFVNIDSRGQEGLERAFDDRIGGERLDFVEERDARGRTFTVSGGRRLPMAGSTVELTLDAGIQAVVERELAAGVEAARAVGGVAIVMDPMTGGILAMASVPTFDPNTDVTARTLAWRKHTRNQAVSTVYEPGSTMKAIFAAAALDEGITSPERQYFCENGRFRFANHVIRDAHPHGLLTFAEVIQYSSNICTSKVASQLGATRWYQYLRAFGFGSRTGIDVPAEANGILRAVESWAPVDLATHSFGQGVAVTPLQMVTAISAIANGGTLMQPYLVQRVVAANGKELYVRKPVAVRRVVSEEAARTTAELLRRVVEEKGGTGSRAKVEHFHTAGKTGTSQKAREGARGYSHKRIGSFVGFVPVESPRIAVLVLIDEPGTTSYGGVVAAPVFRAIATEALRILDVMPPGETVPVPAEHAERLPVESAKRTAPARPPLAELVATDPDATPNYLGLSLREALTQAHAAGWDVDVDGWGYVTAQRPLPGAAASPQRRLALTLRPDGAAVAR